jgi:DNA modification methylase
MNTQPLTWRTEQRKVSDLVPNAKNPRSLSAKQKADLEASITKFNIAELMAVNTDNAVLAGHARLIVLKALGRSDELIDVRIPSRTLTKEECEEYMLRSNRNTGSWNHELLRAFDTSFLLDIGFDDTDLSDIWEDVLEIEDDDFKEEGAIEEAKDTDIKDGDRFQLGDHLLACGDSRNLEIVQRLVGDAEMHVVYTDPNFNIGLSYSKGLGGAKQYGDDLNDKKPDAEYREDIRKAMENAIAVSAKDSHHLWYHDPRYTGTFQSLFEELGIKYKRTALWIKNGLNVTPQIAFSRMYESCLYGTVGKPYLSPKHTKFGEILNKEIGIGNATIDDISDMIDIWLAKRDAGSSYTHSAQKPITLHERPLNRCSKIGQHILDLYGGSGSTLLACEQMKRKAFLIERSPVFCQLIINRYEDFTGNKAVKLD